MYVYRVQQILKAVVDAKNILTENNIPTEVYLFADKNHLIIIFRNLLQNTTGTAHEQGTGLGLVLVNELVEINKGKIVVRSEPQQGTIFEVGFPKA